MFKDYKSLLQKGGIYKIYYINAQKYFYIGSAVNFNLRKIRHRHHLKKKIHKNKKLQRINDKYGSANFVFEILEVVDDKNKLIEIEQHYINLLKPNINILKVAGSALGYRHTEDAKKTISFKNKGRKMTEEQIKKGVIARIGQRTSKGCKRTDEYKIHLSNIKKKKVIDTSTNIIYNSIGDGALFLGLKYSTFYAKLSGKNINNTTFKFL